MNVQRVKRHEWLPVVRRVRCNPSVKLVALTAATYGNAEGGSIFPGIARLANVTGLDDTTVKLALKTLRDLGLMRRVFEGSSAGRRGGMADEHVLTLPAAESALSLLPADESDPGRDEKRAARRVADVERKRRKRKEQVVSSSEQVVSDVGTGCLSSRRPQAETTPPEDGPDHVSVHRPHHSARIERDRGEPRPRPESFAEFEQRHRSIMVRDGEVLDDEDAEFVRGRIGEDYVIAKAGDLDEFEERTALGMLSNGAHPRAVVNTLMKGRGEGEADYRAAQVFLLGLPDEQRQMYVDTAREHTAAHFPDASDRFPIILAARLAQRKAAS